MKKLRGGCAPRGNEDYARIPLGRERVASNSLCKENVLIGNETTDHKGENKWYININ